MKGQISEENKKTNSISRLLKIFRRILNVKLMFPLFIPICLFNAMHAE